MLNTIISTSSNITVSINEVREFAQGKGSLLFKMKTMRFFHEAFKVKSSYYLIVAEKVFIDDKKEHYNIKRIDKNGNVQNVLQYGKYKSYQQAKEALNRIVLR